MEPSISVEKHPDFKTIIVSGMFGGHRPGYVEAVAYTDELVADDALKSIKPDSTKIAIKRTLQCRLYFDPATAKSVAQWLNKHILDYETEFGTIIVPKEPEPQRSESGSKTASD